MVDPIYRQIADDLRRQIETGELEPGDQLKTEQELQEEYGASRNTIRDAIKWLITRRLVETRPGQGMFVPDAIDPFVTPLSAPPGEIEKVFGVEGAAYASEVEASLRSPKITVPRVEVQQATERLAPELQLPPGTHVVSRHQRRSIDGRLWSLQTSFYPMWLVEQGAIKLLQAQDIDEGAVSYLNQNGTKLVGWRDKIKVRAPDREETDSFRLPDDGRIAVIETRRTGYDKAGIPFVLTVSVYPSDRNEFVLDVGHVPAEVGGPAPTAKGAQGVSRPEPDSQSAESA
jgi:GntR family transcriptional regulator